MDLNNINETLNLHLSLCSIDLPGENLGFVTEVKLRRKRKAKGKKKQKTLKVRLLLYKKIF